MNYARRILAAFNVLPSELGLSDPLAESTGSLSRQRRRELRTRHDAPGDFAAEIARIDDRYARWGKADA